MTATVASAAMMAGGVSAEVTSLFPPLSPRNEIYNYIPGPDMPADSLDMVVEEEELYVDPMLDDAYIDEEPLDSSIVFLTATPLPAAYLRPAVFDSYHMLDTLRIETVPLVQTVTDYPGASSWINEDVLRQAVISRARQNYIVNNPQLIIYNEAHLPEPPRKFTATVDPETALIVMKEVLPEPVKVNTDLEVKFGKKHWLKTFTANLQFSQAYVSPNWYQGGNNNLNALANLYYNVKLNTAFHPNWLFENTFQYKLGMNNAPDDDLRDYSISEDLFQWNMTVGYKSTKRWYYSMNASFKTQFLNNYKTNTNDLKAAFLSPGELNMGIGMTYNYANPKKTVTFDASISPLSWNMKTCTNGGLNVESFGIKKGRKTVNEIGSSAEGKFFWQMADNISLRSRLFVFTDYDYIQSDFENTLMFTINRFLTTQIYVHMRYDSSTKRLEDSDWHKFQLKEILSFGFTYKFTT
ncbi:MAG: DUF3078 domain-containing protein [Muribaculaceae bacterium]|nr:DUF3078 domain-containing protein [Muribaculaceae bacterium]